VNKGLLIGTGIFLSVLVAGFFFLNNSNKVSPSPVPTASISPEVIENAPLKEFTITETEYAFSPTTMNVNVGDRVKITFINSGSFDHDFIIDELDLNTGETEPGGTSTLEFIASKAGTYTYYCGIKDHREEGMEGTLTVTE
jgi:plastocyanin